MAATMVDTINAMNEAADVLMVLGAVRQSGDLLLDVCCQQ